MISSMYMGEIVRRIIVQYTQRGLLFKGKLPPPLYKAMGFDTKHVMDIARYVSTSSLLNNTVCFSMYQLNYFLFALNSMKALLLLISKATNLEGLLS